MRPPRPHWVTLMYLLWRERLVSLLPAFLVGVGWPLLVGFSRVYLDLHWATDVLGGWLLGLAWRWGPLAGGPGGPLAEWRRRAKELKADIYALYLAAGDRRVPWYAKALALLVTAYAFSPIELIPGLHTRAGPSGRLSAPAARHRGPGGSPQASSSFSGSS